jgi:DNA-binding CsgD family transcriptional regulator
MRGSSKVRGYRGSPGGRDAGDRGIVHATTTARDLTARELEVLTLVSERLENGEIANRLGVARSSVSTLLRSAMVKLDSRTRAQAVARLAEIDEHKRRR